jgi:sugar lactone lactonase YvrE
VNKYLNLLGLTLLVLLSFCLQILAQRETGAVLVIDDEGFFPEGIAVDAEGAFYVGSMELGSIMRIPSGGRSAEAFIEAGSNGLVTVLGLFADDERNLLWVCNSDWEASNLTGTAPVAILSFDLQTGEAVGSYAFPDGGFCNDLTVDEAGNVYASDSWSPRILRLPVGGDTLEVWVEDEIFGSEQWSLNGLDVANGELYIVNQRAGRLFRVSIDADGSADSITEIETSQELRRPDGLKIIGENLLAIAEAGSGGMALVHIDGDSAEVEVISEGLDGIATFAYWQGSAWVVENQGQHFWDPANSGSEADLPFRIVEVLLPS